MVLVIHQRDNWWSQLVKQMLEYCLHIDVSFFFSKCMLYITLHCNGSIHAALLSVCVSHTHTHNLCWRYVRTNFYDVSLVLKLRLGHSKDVAFLHLFWWSSEPVFLLFAVWKEIKKYSLKCSFAKYAKKRRKKNRLV